MQLNIITFETYSEKGIEESVNTKFISLQTDDCVNLKNHVHHDSKLRWRILENAAKLDSCFISAILTEFITHVFMS